MPQPKRATNLQLADVPTRGVADILSKTKKGDVMFHVKRNYFKI